MDRVRLIPCVLLLLLVAAFGIGRAHAAPRPGAPMYPTREAALTACKADSASLKAYFAGFPGWTLQAGVGTTDCVYTAQVGNTDYGPSVGFYICDLEFRHPEQGSTRRRCDQNGANAGFNAGSQQYYAKIECPTDKPWNPTTQMCGQSKCPAGTSQGPRFGTSDRLDLVGALRCASECEVVYQKAASGYVEGIMTGAECKPDDYKCPAGTMEVLSPGIGQTCEPIKPCPAGQQKDPETGQCMKPAECPAGQVKDADGNCKDKEDACPAGQTKAPDGSCVRNECPEGQARGSDGTCKPDEDDDGKPDEGEDSGHFGDSTDCNTPPKCSGDNILCGQVIIQWRIECNTRKKANVAGGACGAGAAPPICDGEGCNSQMQAQLIQQWRAACALEALKAPGGDGQQPEWTKVPGMSQNPGDGETAADKPGVTERDLDASGLDAGGFIGGGGSCPSFAGVAGVGELSSGFLQSLVNPPPMWCNFIGMIFYAFVVSGTIAAVFIVARGV